MGNAQLEAFSINIADLEMGGLGEPEPAAEDGHEKHPGQRVAGGTDVSVTPTPSDGTPGVLVNWTA